MQSQDDNDFSPRPPTEADQPVEAPDMSAAGTEWRAPEPVRPALWEDRRVRIGAIAAGVVLTIGVVIWNVLFMGMPKLPHSDELWTLNREPAVQFVDASGKTMAVRGYVYGPVVRGAELPPYLGQAFIAAEDQRFMEHGGIDLKSIGRAVLANISAGKTVQGGSTLTQQLVKNLLVGNDQTLRRKVQEARLAMDMEAALTKQEILDLYLNRVYLGANAYGVEAAAQTYFGKPASELTLLEAAFLAALPKAPSRYADDRTGPETKARVGYVLDRMVASGFVSRQQAQAAKADELKFVDGPSREPMSGYVLDLAMQEARAAMPELPPDAVIVLTVDAALQRRAEAALESTLSVKRLGASEGAIVVMDRHGPIRALVGGRDYKASQFNRVTQAKRQPGSAFKPFVYAAALERGLEPVTIREDAPVKFGSWEPRNYEDNYLGQITLARALAVSSNSVAAQVGAEVGPKRIADLAKRFGVESPLSAYPSIALGADEVTLIDLTKAYGVLANEGKRVRPYIVSEIRDQRGQVLYRAPEVAGEQVFDRGRARVMTGMLANVVRAGTGVQARVSGWDIAGKTGTSQSWRDAWFVGYSARLVGGVWIGNDDDRATRKATGGSAAAALFSKVMTAAHASLAATPLPGADMGAEWMGPAIEDPVPDEWFDIPGLDVLAEYPDFLASADSLISAPVEEEAPWPVPQDLPQQPVEPPVDIAPAPFPEVAPLAAPDPVAPPPEESRSHIAEFVTPAAAQVRRDPLEPP